MINLGIEGLGHIGRIHHQASHKIENAGVVAVATSLPKMLADRFTTWISFTSGWDFPQGYRPWEFSRHQEAGIMSRQPCNIRVRLRVWKQAT